MNRDYLSKDFRSNPGTPTDKGAVAYGAWDPLKYNYILNALDQPPATENLQYWDIGQSLTDDDDIVIHTQFVYQDIGNDGAVATGLFQDGAADYDQSIQIALEYDVATTTLSIQGRIHDGSGAPVLVVSYDIVNFALEYGRYYIILYWSRTSRRMVLNIYEWENGTLNYIDLYTAFTLLSTITSDALPGGNHFTCNVLGFGNGYYSAGTAALTLYVWYTTLSVGCPGNTLLDMLKNLPPMMVRE